MSYENYFCVRHKNKRKHNLHFKLLFFTINLHFLRPKEVSTYRKLNLTLITSFYLVFFTFRSAKKTLTEQSIPHTFLLWRETTHKPSKVAAGKTLFSRMYIIGTTCFNKCFLFCRITEDITFHQSLYLHRHFLIVMLLLFF